MRVRLDRVAGFVAIGLVATFGAGLAGWWWIDRTTVYERPEWNEQSFEPLSAPRTSDDAGGETWVMAVNPHCSHCMTTLASLADTLGTGAGAPRLIALIVDAGSRPAERDVAHPRLDGVFWDRDQVWRSHWGHRLYGELMRFGRDGRWLDESQRPRSRR